MSDVQYRRFARARVSPSAPWSWVDLGIENAPQGETVNRDPLLLRQTLEEYGLAALDLIIYVPLDPIRAGNRNGVTEHDPG
jgi:hypothetical protein